MGATINQSGRQRRKDRLELGTGFERIDVDIDIVHRKEKNSIQY